MTFLVENDLLGSLVVDEVFLFYDGPRLFIAENLAGQKYLVNCLDSDAETDSWLLAAISERRLFALKDRSMSLKEVYTSPELGTVLRVVTDKASNLLESRFIRGSDLTPDELPEEGVMLTLELEDDTRERNAAVVARSLNSNVALLYLYPGKNIKEAPAKQVGRILERFEDYVSSKLNAILGSSEQAHGFSVNMLGTFAGSIGVEIAVRGSDPRIGDSLKEAVRELSATGESSALEEQMSTAEDEEVDALKKFLTELKRAKSDLKVEVASREDVDSTKAEVSLPRVREAIKNLRRDPRVRDESRTLVAELVGLNLRTRKFEIFDIETRQRHIGTVAAEIFSGIQTAELPARYRVVIEGVVRRAITGSESVTQWKMISATKL